MGVVIGLVLVAFGAILTWAVSAEANGLNVTAVGVILLVIGIVVILLDLLWWRTWTWYSAGPPWRRTYVRETGQPVQTVQTYPTTVPNRRVVVDEEVSGPSAGPPPP
jgi:hypothetical protein